MNRYNTKHPLKVFTAFSGYDSQLMGLDMLKEYDSTFDYECVGWSEIDKYAIQAHNAVYPQYADRNYGDISKVEWKDVPDFELFTYSFPCQDISSAGNQRGLEAGSGTRSSLLWECERAIDLKRPRYLLMENVKALVSKKFMPFFMEWVRLLEGYGYHNYWKVLNSKDYGVPQNRERVFMVSILSDDAFEFPKPFPLEKRLKDVLETNVDESYYLKSEVVNRFCRFPSDRLNNNDIEVVGTIAANPKDSEGNIIYDKSTRGWVYNPNKIIGTISATDYKQPKQILATDEVGY